VIRVLIAEDMHMIRGALVALLRSNVTSTSSPNSIEAIRSLRQHCERTRT